MISLKGTHMTDEKFTIYNEKNVILRGSISDGRMNLESIVFGDYDSEKYYLFSRKDTGRLLSLVSLDQFIDICRTTRLSGMEDFLKKHDIHPETFTI